MNVIAEHLRSNEPTLVIWLAHTEELCEQSASEFEKAWSYLGNREVDVFRFWGDRELPLDMYVMKSSLAVWQRCIVLPNSV